MDAVSLAYEIVSMDRRLNELERENKRLRQIEVEYREFVSNTIKHEGQMQQNYINAILGRVDQTPDL